MPILELPQEDMDHDHVTPTQVIDFYDLNVEKKDHLTEIEKGKIVDKVSVCRRCWGRYQSAKKIIKKRRGEEQKAAFESWFTRVSKRMPWKR